MEKRTYLGYKLHYKEYKTWGEENNPNGLDKITHKTHMIKEQIKDGYMNGQDKVKHITHRIKEHITCGHDDIKHMTHRMREPNPNGQVKIKRRTHAKKPTNQQWAQQCKTYDTSDGEKQPERTILNKAQNTQDKQKKYPGWT